MTQENGQLERVLMEVLWELTKLRIRYRFRTRLAIFDDTRLLWSQRNASAQSPDNAGIEAALVHLIGRGLVEVGGPTNKRVRLTQEGKDYAVKLLGVTPPKSPT